MDSTLVLLQARVSSSRLPAKVLLPVCNMPVVVLAAKRAANTKLVTKVVTSDEESDDVLVEYLEHYNIDYYRGSLQNVLQRFVDAANGYSDTSTIVRLTADNIYPDGSFIDELVQELQNNNMQYLSTSSPDDGLPYGLSVEVMKMSVIREAYNNTEDPYDLEHVTPWIKRKYQKKIFDKYQKEVGMGKYRCTIDTLEDYLSIQKVFKHVANPVDVSWKSLCEIQKNITI